MMLTVNIPGPCVPWQRTAAFDGRRLTPKTQRAYQRHVRACVSVALLGKSWPTDRRYSVRIHYVPQDKRRRDLDNVAKTLLDACNGALWNDDAQIDSLHVDRESIGNVGVTMVVLGRSA